MPDTLRIIVKIALIGISVALVVLVLIQQGKGNGISGLSGTISNTYWGRNKGRSTEGRMKKVTAILITAFCVCALLLSVHFPTVTKSTKSADKVTEASSTAESVSSK